MSQFIGLFGIFVLLGIAYLFSHDKKNIPWPLVIKGLVLQWILALLVLGIPAFGWTGPLAFLFQGANDVVISLLAYTAKGSAFLFGNLVKDTSSFGFIFAFQVLPTIIFMSSLMSVLYHLGIMQLLVWVIAILMHKTMKISGAESLSVAANVFVGQTEAPLIVKPYLKKMTESELLSIMVGGMATVAGGVLAAYVLLLQKKIPDIAGHLLTASVMSAPAALLIAKMLIPETMESETMGKVPNEIETESNHNIIEAAAKGAGEGLSLALNVGGMLLAFIALIALSDGILSTLGEAVHFSSWGKDLVPEIMYVDGKATLTFSVLLGWIFSPIAWVMGIPLEEIGIAGALLGEKLILNEMYAYEHLAQIMNQLSDRTTIILSYALCGFANFSSIAIQIGGIGGLAPTRKSDLARLGVKSIIGGSLAAFMTATIAGILL
ncbi:MAG: hypothetical protein KDD61_15850 [Bdellovibrionales bacterium]|nr:hypothetical protein [Bdellovibrionales bacterium]